MAMPGTNADWIRLGTEIVSQNEPCKPAHLRSALRRSGASVRVANETLLVMIRDGHVRRTWNGRLKLR
jgi:hypothetical protein